MNAGFLQSTLREMQVLLRSRNLWLTFAAVVMLFAVIGPYGTMERLPFLQRLFYWLVLHAGAWSVALLFAVIGDVVLQRMVPGLFWRMLIGSLFAAIPIALIIGGVQWLWFGKAVTGFDLLSEIAMSIPLCGIFCVISYLAMSAAPAPINAASPALPVGLENEKPVTTRPAPAESPIISRLKPENRGALRHLSVEDHYTLVTTSRGRELILLRFSDAVREAGETGVQVHRSHWVAFDFVDGLIRDNGRLALRLKDGSEIPVSRTHAAYVRARFG